MSIICFFLLCTITVYMTTVPAEIVYAVSAGTGQSKSQSQRLQREKSVQQQRSKNITITNSQSHRTSDAKKLTMTVSLDSLILASMARLEVQGGFYNQCGLVLSPPLPVDLGITAEVGGAGSGVVDVVKMSYIETLAKSGGYVSHLSVDTQALKQYVTCIAQYAFVVQSVLQSLKRSYNDVAELVRHIDHLVNQYALQRYRINLPDFNTCRFAHSHSAIQCKELYIEIAHNPKLLIKRNKIMSDGFYLNVSSVYTTDKSTASELSRATSDALQHVASLSMTYKRGQDLQQQQDASTQARTP